MVDMLCQLVCFADVRLGDSRVDMLDGSQVWGDGLLRVSSLRPQWLSVRHLFAEHCKNVRVRVSCVVVQVVVSLAGNVSFDAGVDMRCPVGTNFQDLFGGLYDR